MFEFQFKRVVFVHKDSSQPTIPVYTLLNLCSAYAQRKIFYVHKFPDRCNPKQHKNLFG